MDRVAALACDVALRGPSGGGYSEEKKEEEEEEEEDCAFGSSPVTRLDDDDEEEALCDEEGPAGAAQRIVCRTLPPEDSSSQGSRSTANRHSSWSTRLDEEDCRRLAEVEPPPSPWSDADAGPTDASLRSTEDREGVPLVCSSPFSQASSRRPVVCASRASSIWRGLVDSVLGPRRADDAPAPDSVLLV